MTYDNGVNKARALLGLEKVAYNARTTRRIMDVLKRMGVGEVSRTAPRGELTKELTLPAAKGPDLTQRTLTRDRLNKLFDREVSEVDFDGLGGLEKGLRDHHPLLSKPLMSRDVTRATRETALAAAVPEQQRLQGIRDYLATIPQKRLFRAARAVPESLLEQEETARKLIPKLQKQVKKHPNPKFIKPVLKNNRALIKTIDRIRGATADDLTEAMAEQPDALLRRYAAGSSRSDFKRIPDKLIRQTLAPDPEQVPVTARQTARGRRESQDWVRDVDTSLVLPKKRRMLAAGPLLRGIQGAAEYQSVIPINAKSTPARAKQILTNIPGYNPAGPSAEEVDNLLMSGRHVKNKMPLGRLPDPDTLSPKTKKLKELPGFKPRKTVWRGGQGSFRQDAASEDASDPIWVSGIPQVSAGYTGGLGGHVTGFRPDSFTNPPVRYTPHVAKDTRDWSDKKIRKAVDRGHRTAGVSEVGDSRYYEAVVDRGEMANAKPKSEYRQLHEGLYHTGGRDLLRKTPKKKD